MTDFSIIIVFMMRLRSRFDTRQSFPSPCRLLSLEKINDQEWGHTFNAAIDIQNLSLLNLINCIAQRCCLIKDRHCQPAFAPSRSHPLTRSIKHPDAVSEVCYTSQVDSVNAIGISQDQEVSFQWQPTYSSLTRRSLPALVSSWGLPALGRVDTRRQACTFCRPYLLRDPFRVGLRK